MKLLLYCTKAKPYLIDLRRLNCGFQTWKCDSKANLNGKIVAECDFEVEELFMGYGCGETFAKTKTMQLEEILKRSCLSEDELCEYMPNYAIHIKNLKIFDEPRELTYYCRITKSLQYEGEEVEEITKAPQNMMSVYDYVAYTDCILISIRPEWLCKILNGKKTIEVRRKVLKEMLNNG